MKHCGKKTGILALIFLLSLLMCGCQSVSPNENSIMKISFLKVGRADAIIIEKDKEVMVIDTGEEDDGEEIVDFIQKENIEKIDYLIITHFDSDHIGGADTLLENVEVTQIILPDYESDNLEYLDFMKAVKEKDYTPVLLHEDHEFNFSDCKVLINPPDSYIYDGSVDYDNNLSLIVSIEYGNHSFLFTGDAEKQRLNEWLNKDLGEFTFIKIPHHGVYNSVLKKLLEKTGASYAVICDSKKNPADKQTLKLLDKYHVMTWETKDGNITLTSDGARIEISQR